MEVILLEVVLRGGTGRISKYTILFPRVIEFLLFHLYFLTWLDQQMQIYIKTAPYNQNSYFQHLIEHLVIGGYWSLQQYFKVAYWVHWTSWLNYSSYFIPPTLQVNEVLKQFFSSLDMSIVDREVKMINEELSGNISDITLLVNRIGRSLYWSTFWRAQFWTKFSKKIIQLEHQKYYNEDHLRIADDDFLILHRPSNVLQSVRFDELEYSVPSKKCNVRWDSYFIKIFNETPSSYVLCYFLDWLMGVRGEYSSNYIGRQYMSPVFREFFEYPKHFLLVVDRDTRAFLSSTPIDQEFFVLAKKRFLETSVILQEISLILEIRTGKIVENFDLKKTINSLKVEDVRQLLFF